MKIIKYRIYNPIEKRMIESGATPTMLSSFFGVTSILHVAHKMKYQQYTGLLDLNGKEIYEGDIVDANIYADETPQTLTVEFRKGAFVIDYEDSEFDCFLVGEFPGTLKVVGNIYEEKP